MGLHSYSWSSLEAATYGSYERSFERREKCGFPRKCLSNSNPVLLTCTSNDNLGDNVGKKFYTCKNRENGGCSVLKWWDDDVMEEVEEIKTERDGMEDMLQYMNTNSRGELVVHRMMFMNVRQSRDDVYHLQALCEATEEKFEELKLKVEVLDSFQLSLEVQRSIMAVKEMKRITLIVVVVALVAFFIVPFK